jgi:hypothetical protein
MKKKFTSTLFLLFVLTIVKLYSQDTFYVSNSGNDNYTGTNPIHFTGTNIGPWKTVKKVNSYLIKIT